MAADKPDDLPPIIGDRLLVASETTVRALIEQCCHHYIATGQDFAQMEVSMVVEGRAFRTMLGIALEEIVGPDRTRVQ